ncbi:MAG: winged helix-turn-helix domain-containing protein [candidate division Zixibacteria bacterium]|nr:winged helix-turn-helix domain-containing protein [candidate division Zixibacteria bacterium]
MTQQTAVKGFRFDDFVLDIHNRQVRRKHAVLPLSSRYFDVLVLLVSNAGQLVEKNRIFDEVWEDVIVSDTALTQCIKSIRKQLEDDASNPRYVKTVPKHGYVFIGEAVEIVDEPSPQAAKDKPTRPYKFLDYYTENDQGLFFGREEEIENICSRILARRSFLLYGRSGVGKSSILRAGVIPRLQDQGHRTCIIRSFTDPLQHMRRMVRRIVTDNGAGGFDPDGVSLQELLRRNWSGPASRIVVMLDQFEEFFLLLDEPGREAFVDELAVIMEDDALPLQFVFVMREDMLAEMSRIKPAVPEIFHHEYRLSRLTSEQAAQAITGPAWRVGCRYEDALVDHLLEDLSDEDSVDPPHLQIVCDTLYDQRNTKNLITESAYDQLGGASQILADYLARVLRRFSAADLSVVQQVLLALISAEERLIVVREAELASRIQAGDRYDADALGTLLGELVDARIIRRRNQEGEGWLELAHECMIPEVSRWLTGSVYEAKQARSLLERSVENYRTYQLIMDRESLDLLAPYLEEIGVTGDEAYLLCISLLNRDRPVPSWLVEKVPDAVNVILEAMYNDRREVRKRAVESSRPVRCAALNNRLRHLALRDPMLSVRRAASIELADWFGSAVESVLTRPTGNESVSRLQRAVSLAFLREQNRSVKLSRLYRVMVMVGFILMRLQQGGIDIMQQGVGGTFGGAVSGLFGGLLLGTALAAVSSGLSSEALTPIFVLAGLGVFGGAFGGAGVSFGMVALRRVSGKYSRWLGVLGGALGGGMVGAAFKLYSSDTLQTLFGRQPAGLTGGLEGALIGAGVALGPVVTYYLVRRPGQWRSLLYIVFGALGGMIASIVLTVMGGNMFTASLETLRQSFDASQIRLETIATIFGEGEFGRTTQVALGALEGLLFGGGVTAGIEFFTRSRERVEGRYGKGMNRGAS